MAEVIDYMVSQAVQLTGSHDVAVTDATGSFNASLGGGAWYRFFAAKTAGGAGTETNPYELLHRFRALLGIALWDVTLRPNGRVRLSYSGAGLATIVWTSTTVRNLLGFAANLNVGSGLSVDAPNLPTHVVYASAANDSGWTVRAGRFSGARMPHGRVYGWGDNLQTLTRSLDLRLLPKDDATRAALIALDATDVPGTPAYGLTSRRTNPGAAEPGQAHPWGASELVATGGGRSLGCILGTLQTAIATPAGAAYEVAFLTPECVNGGASVKLSVEGYDPRRDLAGLELSYVAEETRA